MLGFKVDILVDVNAGSKINEIINEFKGLDVHSHFGAESGKS